MYIGHRRVEAAFEEYHGHDQRSHRAHSHLQLKCHRATAPRVLRRTVVDTGTRKQLGQGPDLPTGPGVVQSFLLRDFLRESQGTFGDSVRQIEPSDLSKVNRLPTENPKVLQRRHLTPEQVREDCLYRVDRPPGNSPPTQQPCFQRGPACALRSTVGTEDAVAFGTPSDNDCANYVPVNHVTGLRGYLMTVGTHDRVDDAVVWRWVLLRPGSSCVVVGWHFGVFAKLVLLRTPNPGDIVRHTDSKSRGFCSQDAFVSARVDTPLLRR